MSDLTDHQQKAFEEVCSRLASGDRYVGLRGYAGTGKTYLVTRLVEKLIGADLSVTVCAPTHKAVQVLTEQLHDAPTQMKTLHSFLGLRLRPGKDGRYELVPEGDRDYGEGIVIVDEASMIGEREWAFIEDSPIFLQWLFVGDPAQLPPVNESASPALEVPGPMLTEVHRQARTNPILDLATQVREGTCDRFQSRYTNGTGVAITHNAQGFRQSILRTFDDDAFDDNASHARVLAYRNRTVRRYNREIRAARYGGDAPRFEPGEWIVARETWYHEKSLVVLNSEEVRVKEAAVETFEAEDMSEWTVWTLTVRSPARGVTETLHVLHEDEQERYENDLERLKTQAKGDARRWQGFFELRERFARVDYAYATTVHRAQGSTFNTVFVDHRDLQACWGEERNALLYVAVTRPAQRLALLV
jgi:exodeoxyribonuclease-5